MGFRYRTLLRELLHACVIGHLLDTGHAITTLAKFSTHPAPFHYHKLCGVAKYFCHTIKDWGIACWCDTPNEYLPDIPHVIPIYDPSADLPPFPLTSLREPPMPTTFVINDLPLTGHTFILAGAAIAYRRKTQSITATSSTEAEFLAAALLERSQNISAVFSLNSDVLPLAPPFSMKTTPQQ
jgi:hypothetical protein